ncbi:ABC-three component system middle component 6 [Sulfurovum lithotrophicum]|nr:ABC-three component system middle component 6 [Sulfurovum lithotrophicum]
MVMGDKIFKIEDALIVIGSEVVNVLQKYGSMRLDDIFLYVKDNYVKDIKFDRLIYTVDFLYMIGKINIKEDDILELL